MKHWRRATSEDMKSYQADQSPYDFWIIEIIEWNYRWKKFKKPTPDTLVVPKKNKTWNTINAQSASLRSLVAAEITLLAQQYCVSWEVFETLVQRCCVSWEVFETLVQRCCVIWEKCSTTIFFAPPPLQIKLGGPIAVNCSGIKMRHTLMANVKCK